MEAQEIILFLAEYIDQGLDRETTAVLDYELNYDPKAVLFLISYSHALSFYKRHRHDNGKISWIMDYLDQRMPGSLKEVVQKLLIWRATLVGEAVPTFQTVPFISVAH